MIKKSLNSIIFPLLKIFFLSSILFGKHTFAGHKNDFLLAEANQKINVEHAKETVQLFTRWENLVFHNLGKDVYEKLKLVNDFYNQMNWVEDKENWNKEDYWATPIESMIRNAGDCEDFSIAKYFTLLAMDIPEEQLKITYVRLNNHQGHMVLIYYPDDSSEPLILDNMKKDILKKTDRPDLKIVFSFNSEGLWLSNNKTSKPTEKNIIHQWAQMIKRIKNE
ncbi:MAG: transglutaminase-like cysteine peptidase [gamma proteobacterium symbiont of Taylorina sp.]|nr:transglutaminase-like cysteine peptidase [gamma proteobacterium symbiont of Taylorina sp.]